MDAEDRECLEEFRFACERATDAMKTIEALGPSTCLLLVQKVIEIEKQRDEALARALKAEGRSHDRS